jgi:uncharacterized protein (DUF924 family)
VKSRDAGLSGKNTMNAAKVIDFWFSDRVCAKWWDKDEDFDAEICDLFTETYQKAICNELSAWRSTASGCLAEVILLDQFSRNMFRDKADAFAYDSMARQCVYDAIAAGLDKVLEPRMRAFLYMPLMHSESLADHEQAIRLYKSDPALEFNLDFEMKHKAIIDRFGRYPHRNEVLNRECTAEETEFLKQPGSSF